MHQAQTVVCLTEPNYREHPQQRDLKDGSSGVCVLRPQTQHDPVITEQGIRVPTQHTCGGCKSRTGTTHCTRKIASVAIDRANGNKSAMTALQQ